MIEQANKDKIFRERRIQRPVLPMEYFVSDRAARDQSSDKCGSVRVGPCVA